jgi:predicted GNAT family acetyltransferase
MPDMLVKLYELPDYSEIRREMEAKGIVIRRAIAPEKHVVTGWVRSVFSDAWASECETAFSNHPVSCYIAVENGKMIGFSCYDATCRNFFGPTGISTEARGRGAGKALLLSCLHDMEAQGYAYAIIGGAGPVEFYSKTVGATIIEGSKPGIYKGMLTTPEAQ